MEPTTLIASLTLFALAIFLGFELITKVPPTLHTPLMSGANAISGISIVGAIIGANVLRSRPNPNIRYYRIPRSCPSYSERSGWLCRDQQDATDDCGQEKKEG